TEQKIHLAKLDDSARAEVQASTAHLATRQIGGFEEVVPHGKLTLGDIITATHLLHSLGVATTKVKLLDEHHDTSVSRRQPSVIDNARGVMAMSGLWRRILLAELQLEIASSRLESVLGMGLFCCGLRVEGVRS